MSSSQEFKDALNKMLTNSENKVSMSTFSPSFLFGSKPTPEPSDNSEKIPGLLQSLIGALSNNPAPQSTNQVYSNPATLPIIFPDRKQSPAVDKLTK